MATPGQTLIIRPTFHNPLVPITTYLSVKPTAIDPLDTGREERIYINRI